MDDTTVTAPSSEKSLATLAGISRRLGVTAKQLYPFVVDARLESSMGSNGEALYSVDDVVEMLEGLKGARLSKFVSIQKPVTFTTALYKKKFAPLRKWIPGSKDIPEPVKAKLGLSDSFDGNSLNSKDMTPKVFAELSGFENPLTAQQLSKYLKVSLKCASEAIYGSGLPTAQLKNILVVDLPRNTLGSFVANLPDGLREKVLLAQHNRGQILSKKRLADILALSPNQVDILLKALPGSPMNLSQAGLDYVKSLPSYHSMLVSLDNSDRAYKGGRRAKNGRRAEQRVRRVKNVSVAEIASYYNISEEDAVLLGKRKFFPRYNPTEGTVHEISKRIPESFVNQMIDDNCYTIYSLAKEIKVQPQTVERALLKSEIKPLRSYLLKGRTISHKIILYSEESVENFRRSEHYEEILKMKEANDSKSLRVVLSAEEEAEVQEITQEIEDRVVVDARERFFAPKKSVFYVGPTNSGKTYNSLNELFAEYERNEGRGLYVYAGPLRMLAFEVYEKMAERYGEDKVGFLTGEEQINPDANMLACTVEMAPDEGTSLVLDEAHWIVESSRGQHWTHLLMAGRYTNMHILTAKEALDTLKDLVSDSENISVREFERRTPIVYSGELSLKEIPARTAVVAFSRRTVYAIAGDLARIGKKVGVLYGALPLKVRKAQIEKYVNGEYDIMVTTDVIGHGINLPIDNVVFAQTEKFDGRERREIHVWEAAQIAGRAGRFGLSLSGNVYGLTGRGWYSKNVELMKAGTDAAAGLIATDLVADKAILFPRFGDLNVQNATELPPAVVAWQQKAYILMEDRPVTPSDLSTQYKLFERVAETAAIPQHKPQRSFDGLSADTVWQLMSGPFDPKRNVISTVTRWLIEGNIESSSILEEYFDRLIIPVTQVLKSGKGLHKDQVGMFENISSEIGELKMAYIMFGTGGTLLLAELVEYEDIIDSLLIRSLSAAVKSSKYGKCEKCNKNCSPWFSLCDKCSFEKSWW